jgi:hypothetical protein
MAGPFAGFTVPAGADRRENATADIFTGVSRKKARPNGKCFETCRDGALSWD